MKALCGCDCPTNCVTNTTPEPFQSKMDDWEQCAPAALRYLIEWMQDEPETLLAIAKGRVAWGHYRHGDTLMYELSEEELVANASEELSDAINYIARLIHIRDNRESPMKFAPYDEMVAS